MPFKIVMCGILVGMKAPIFVRALTPDEHQQLEARLRSKSAFTLRRAQILLGSAHQQTASQIAANLGCGRQTVRDAIRAFHQRGLGCLEEGSHVPHTVQPVLTAQKRQQLQHILHQSPRLYQKQRSTWTLGLLAEVAFEQGLSESVLSEPTLLDAVRRLDVSWKRAKHWISSPDPGYTRKKTDGSV